MMVEKRTHHLPKSTGKQAILTTDKSAIENDPFIWKNEKAENKNDLLIFLFQKVIFFLPTTWFFLFKFVILQTS